MNSVCILQQRGQEVKRQSQTLSEFAWANVDNAGAIRPSLSAFLEQRMEIGISERFLAPKRKGEQANSGKWKTVGDSNRLICQEQKLD
jgi:hypothetical protein